VPSSVLLTACRGGLVGLPAVAFGSTVVRVILVLLK